MERRSSYIYLDDGLPVNGLLRQAKDQLRCANKGLLDSGSKT